MSINHVIGEGLTIKSISFKATFGNWLFDISEHTTYNLSSAVGLPNTDNRLTISLYNNISTTTSEERIKEKWTEIYNSLSATLTIYYGVFSDVLHKVNSNTNGYIDFHLPTSQEVVNSGQGHVNFYTDGTLTYFTYQYGRRMESYLANSEINMVLSWL